MEKTKVVCPVCKSEFEIPEHQSVTIGVTIAKDSGLGTVCPKVAKQGVPPTDKRKMKADEKIAALKAAGVDVSNLFSMKGADGMETIARLSGGNLSIVPDDDEIFLKIMGSGTIPNRRLFRRWILKQMFDLLSPVYAKSNCNVHEGIRRKGLKYSWRMVTEEMRVQSKLFKNDLEAFSARNRWFNKEVIVNMGEDYMKALKKHIAKQKPRMCKGVKYIRLHRKNIFLCDVDKRVYQPLQSLIDRISASVFPRDVYEATRRLARFVVDTWACYDSPVSASFIDAYKGAGAYYSMRNLIMFHDCRVKDCNAWLSQQDSLGRLEMEASKNKHKGWWLLGMLKQLISDNNIDISKKRAEWRSKWISKHNK